MREDLSDRNYLSAHEDRELVLNQASRWLQEHRNDDIGPVLLVRDLFDLAAAEASQPPARPATISLSRSQFAKAREDSYDGLAPAQWTNGPVLADLRAADALLAAAGLAWKAEEAGEAQPEPAKPRWVSWTGPGTPDSVFDPENQESTPLGDWKSYDPPPAQAPKEADLAAAFRPAHDRCRADACAAEEPKYITKEQWLRFNRDHDREAVRRATFAEVKAGAWGEEAAGHQQETAAMGARIRELLAAEEPPPGLDEAVRFMPIQGTRTEAVWAWLRQQAGLAGEEAGQAARLPEQIGWALDDKMDGGWCEPRLTVSLGADTKPAYAEAVRRYNLHQRLRELAGKWRAEDGPGESFVGKWEAAAELLAILSEGLADG